MTSPLLKLIARRLLLSMPARLESLRACPVPLSDLRDPFAALVHSPLGAALAATAALLVFFALVRSAWFDVYSRWYGR